MPNWVVELRSKALATVLTLLDILFSSAAAPMGKAPLHMLREKFTLALVSADWCLNRIFGANKQKMSEI